MDLVDIHRSYHLTKQNFSIFEVHMEYFLRSSRRSSLNKYKGIEFIASIFPTVISTEENKLKKEHVETKHDTEKNLRVNSEIKKESKYPRQMKMKHDSI